MDGIRDKKWRGEKSLEIGVLVSPALATVRSSFDLNPTAEVFPTSAFFIKELSKIIKKPRIWMGAGKRGGAGILTKAIEFQVLTDLAYIL